MKSIKAGSLKFIIAATVTSALLVAFTLVEYAQAKTLTVGATDSLKGAFRELIPMFENEYGVTVRVVYGPSQALRQQIEKGESIDVFLPEATEDLEVLHKKGLTGSSEPRIYAQSSLVLVMSAAPQASMTFFHHGLSNRPIRIAVANPRTSALGKSTARVATKLKAAYRNPIDLVYVEGSDEILNLVRRGKVDMGIVYRVNAITGGQVHIMDETPAGLHTPVHFGQAVVVSTGRHESFQRAEEFFDFIMSPRIQKLLVHYGFESMPVNQ